MSRWSLPLTLALCGALLGMRCQPTPIPPTPVVDAGPDWADAGSAEERCVETKLADPVVQNVAAKSGTPLADLVGRMCADPLVREPYEVDR